MNADSTREPAAGLAGDRRVVALCSGVDAKTAPRLSRQDDG